MTIREAMATILGGYGSAKAQAFAGHPLARVTRHDFPDAVRAVIPEERYLIEGSAGQGQWAEVPWAAVFDRLITNTARQGFYIVYLFRSDLSGVYLSLNQGVTSIRDVYGADAKKSLIVRAADYRARLGSLPKSFEPSKISLNVPSNSLGAFYEAGNICAAFYSAEALPEAPKLTQDLQARYCQKLCIGNRRILAKLTR